MLSYLRRRLESASEQIIRSFRTAYTPRQTAASFAGGVFLAVLPTFGLAPVIAAAIATRTDRANQYAILAAFALFNPVVLSGIYTLSYGIGTVISAYFPLPAYEPTMLYRIRVFVREFLLGAMLLNVVFTAVSYIIVRRLVTQYQTAAHEIAS